MAARRGTRLESRLLGPAADRPGQYYVRYWLSRVVAVGAPFVVTAEIISQFHPIGSDYLLLIGLPLALATGDTMGRGRRLRPMFLAQATAG